MRMLTGNRKTIAGHQTVDIGHQITIPEHLVEIASDQVADPALQIMAHGSRTEAPVNRKAKREDLVVAHVNQAMDHGNQSVVHMANPGNLKTDPGLPIAKHLKQTKYRVT
jgi:hypothetical protein